MGKVDFHNTGKVWENTNISNLWVSLKFWMKQKSIQFPKHGKSEFLMEIHFSHVYGKSMGKKKNIPKFFKYFGWSRNPYNSQNTGKVNSHSKEKI